MYNQGPTIGRINASFIGAPDEQNPPQKPWMGPPAPQGSHPNTSGYLSQPYTAQGGPQGPYTQQQQFQSMSIYPQRPNAGHTGVMVQPTVFMTTTKPVYVSDYLCYSIFTLMFCFFPLGFAATIFSASTRDANMAGRQDLAIRSSRTALVLNNVALCIGLTIYTVTTLLLLWVYGVI
ncbi:hypothetical protein R3I94_021004 [Phoxinus phoxinus]